MKNKFLDIIEGSFSMLGLVSIITLSIITVGALNPREYAAENIPQVQGIQSDSVSSSIPIKVEDISSNSDLTSELLTNQDGKYELVLNFKNLDQNIKHFSLSKFQNLNDFDKKINISLSTKSLVDDVKISLVDNVDEIILYSNKSSFDRSLTVKSRSTRNMDLKVEVKEKINYPFEVRLQLN